MAVGITVSFFKWISDLHRVSNRQFYAVSNFLHITTSSEKKKEKKTKKKRTRNKFVGNDHSQWKAVPMANDGCNSWVYDSCMIGNSNAQHFRQLAWRFRQISHVYACCYPLNVGILRKDNTKTIEQNTQRHIQLNVMAWCVYNSCHSMPKCGNIYDILMCLLILFLILFCSDESVGEQ